MTPSVSTTTDSSGARTDGPDAPEDERRVKRARLRGLLDRAGVDALALTGSASLSWYLAGARTHVGLAADPVVAVRVSRDDGGPDGVRDEIFLTGNEAARLTAEELPAGLAVHERPWFAPLPDLAAVPESRLAAELRAVRAPLLPVEVDRFRRLGRDVARVLTDALAVAQPHWREQRLAAAVATGVVEAAADPLVVLVGGAARAQLPHPLPTAAALGARALVVVCARRDGLIVNLSRSVAFGPLEPAELDAQQRILAVEQEALDATVPGARLSEVLAVIAGAYARHGFGADHWRGHHQGGVAGYAGRDPRATPDATDLVVTGQAFAWNPWAPGAKVEDTLLLTDDHSRGRFETLSVDPRWPSADVAGRRRPLTWER